MRFRNRLEAADALAERLAAYRGRHPLILGIPRGAVPMARRIAAALEGDLDVVLVRKLRAPGYPELAIGAVDEDGHILRAPHFDELATSEYLRGEVRLQGDVLRSRRQLYTRRHAPISQKGRVVIIVDDGIATGSTMLAAIHSVRAHHPARVVVAIGVAPADTLRQLRAEADEVVCLWAPESFRAVGEFFDDFGEVTDEMVVAALRPEKRALSA
jgi:predicted phosphoribosyltransferase